VTITGVVLAAGEGSRYDGPTHKLLAPFRDRPLVTWAVEQASAADLDRLVVVVGAEVSAVRDAVEPFAVDVVENPRWRGGIATSLATAVDVARDAGDDGVVIGLGDQPFIEAEAWRRVADALREGAAMAVATYDGARRNPVGLAASVWPDLPTDGDEGARTVMRLRPDLVAEIPCPGRPLDIDTLEELRRWS
jgi:molybdenum cofactor cytidylyltransferase/nicotine blue oxidoreductase